MSDVVVFFLLYTISYPILPYSSPAPSHSSHPPPIHPTLLPSTLTEQHLSSCVVFVARAGRGQSERSSGENQRTAQRLAHKTLLSIWYYMTASNTFIKHIITHPNHYKRNITQSTATEKSRTLLNFFERGSGHKTNTKLQKASLHTLYLCVRHRHKY